MHILLQRILLLCQIYNTNIKSLERETELTNSSIRRWANSVPSVDKVQKVADYFGVSVDYLLGRTDDMFSHQSGQSVDFKGAVDVLEDLKAIIEEKLVQATSQKENFLEGKLPSIESE